MVGRMSCPIIPDGTAGRERMDHEPLSTTQEHVTIQPVNHEFQAMADAIERDRARRAHGMTVEQRLLQGAMLFDYACEASLAGLRAQFPAATDAELQDHLAQRLIRARGQRAVGP